MTHEQICDPALDASLIRGRAGSSSRGQSPVCRSGAARYQAFQSGRRGMPSNVRSIDCRMSPPPVDDDPDRKVSGSDGGQAMKVTEEYLENALAFEQLAAVEIDSMLKDDFEKQAVAFRKLAAERAERLGLGPPDNSNRDAPPL
jgi:hypothetical protein